jgi:rod shape-determining protein MreC
VTPRSARLLAGALLVGQLLLVAAQTPDRSGRAPNLLSAVVLSAVGPLARGVESTGKAFAGAGLAMRTRSQLAEENRRLRAELLELRRERLRLDGLELESAALARGLDFAHASGLELRAVEVVYLDPSSWLRALVARVGKRGARVDQVVLAEEGVVGRVIEAHGPWIKVQLITDRAAAVGVVLERARRQGIARGTSPDELEIDYIPRQTEVVVGDRVLTAGIDGVYPRGLPVGVVVAVEPGSEMFHRVRVRPLVDLSQLATVYLLDGVALPPRVDASGSGNAVR